MSEKSTAFQKAAKEGRRGIVAEFLSFLMDNKKWWLLPILIVLLLASLLVILSGSGVAPFIYTLF